MLSQHSSQVQFRSVVREVAQVAFWLVVLAVLALFAAFVLGCIHLIRWFERSQMRESRVWLLSASPCRGLLYAASEIVEVTVQAEEVAQVPMDLSELSVDELRQLARDRGVPRWWQLGQAKLLAALS